MAAITDIDSYSLSFRNLLGAIKLQLTGTESVKSVKIKGKNGERLSGEATITVYSDGLPPMINMSDENGTSVTLDCGEGVQLNESEATTFIIALPPVTFENGFLVQVYGTDGKITQELEAASSNEIVRSKMLVMPIKNDEPVDTEQGIEHDGIKYTCVVGIEDKHLYTIEQKVSGDMVTYSKDNEEIAREAFSKDLNLEVLFNIPEIVYVEKESQLSAVTLIGSSKEGDKEKKREEDGFTITNNTQEYGFRFDAQDRVTASREYEKLQFGSETLPYTHISNISYKSYESSLNEAMTDDDVIVHDVTLYFDVELKERNLDTAQSYRYTVPVTYKRAYERKEHVEIE